MRRRAYSFSTPAGRLALGGIMSLMSLVCLYIVALVPVARLFFFVLASMIPAIVVLKTDQVTAFLSFTAVVLLGYVLLPRRICLIPYSIFFGYYAILKFYLEKLNRYVEICMKIIVFNTTMYLGYRLTRFFIFLPLTLYNMSWPVIIIASSAGFLIYDYLFSYFITIYKHYQGASLIK